jgi:hypothetical protein
LPHARRPVGSRLVSGPALRLSRANPRQLIGLISGVITGVTAGAMGFMGASAFIAGFLAALRAGFFLEAFLEDFFFEDFFFEDFLEAFLEDFFFAAFFLELLFFATRFLEDFLEDFFFADFFDDFFFAAFFFAAMFNSFQCWTDDVVRLGPGAFAALPIFRFAPNKLVSGF